MKVELVTFVAKENGISIQLLPENDIERQLLIGFGKHGTLYFQDRSLRIDWDFKEPPPPKKVQP